MSAAANLPIPLHPNETILKTDENAARIKNNALALIYHVIHGNLWLSNHRLVFQSSVPGGLVSYPLSRIRLARRADVNVSRRPGRHSSEDYDAALYIEFDSGGKEYFIPQNIDEWAVETPDLPFTQAPPARSALEQDRRRIVTSGAIVLGLLLLFLCIYGAFVWVPIVVSLFG